MKEWKEFDDLDYAEAVDLGHISFRKHQRGVRGQMITVADNPTYHIVMEAIRLFKEKNK